METVHSLFHAAAVRHPKRTFLRRRAGTSERRSTYEDVTCRIAALVELFESHGFSPGDRIVFFTEEPEPLVDFGLACSFAGLVPLGLSPTYSMAALKDLVEFVGARAAFCERELVPKLVGAGLNAMYLGPEPHESGAGTWLDIARRPELSAALELLDRKGRRFGPETLYHIQPTSGSTGRPKLAMRTHRTMVRLGRAKAFDLQRDAEPPERMLLITPLTHGMGQGMLVTAIYLACEISLPANIGTLAPLEDIRALDPTLIPLVPRMLKELLAQFEKQGLEGRLFGPSAKLVITGGAAPRVESLRALQQQGIEIIESYGGSESSLIALGERGRWREGYVGKVLPDVETRNEPDGELLVRSPGLFTGYYGDQQATNEVMTEDGFYRTGDYASVEADGYLRYLGRKKDVFNTYDGSNIYPARMETLIEALPWVKQVVLLGDQRPYIIAMIHVATDIPSSEKDGYLPPRAAPRLYEQARADLAKINEQLEANECIRGVALFAVPFDASVMTKVNLEKFRRDRKRLTATHAAHVDRLYSSPSDEERVSAPTLKK